MSETEMELQLKVWKDLAISKQVLMRAATDALKLDPNCSQEELKSALDNAIKRYIEADISVSKAQEQAKVAISTMEKKVADSEKARNIAEAARAETLAQQQKVEQQIAAERINTANEVKKVKERMAESERALKAINAALADTPENVLKKMKALKKEKMDEADARKEVVAANAALRKDMQKLEQRIKDMQAAQDNAAKLAAQYRELHTLCTDLHAQLKPLVEDAKSLAAVPPLNTVMLEGIEKVDAEEEKKTGTKGKR